MSSNFELLKASAWDAKKDELVADALSEITPIVETIGTLAELNVLVDAAELAAIAAQEASLYSVNSADAFFASIDTYPIGSRVKAKSGETWDIVSSNEHFIHQISGMKVRVVPGDRGFNVKAFGAKGDKVTDDSVAVKRAFNAARSGSVTPTVGSNRVILHAIYFPGGEYRISSPRSLMDYTDGLRYVGLTYEGDAAGTSINFDYDGDDYLMYDTNEFLIVRFRKLRFTCNSDFAKFAYVSGNGGAQDFLFDDCTWDGKWQKLYVLQGANNNSEWKWNNCAIAGSIRDVVLEIPETDSSDQFLNYWFVNCKMWLYDGQMIRAHKGGHFHLVNCDMSGLNPNMTLNTSTNGAPLFELLGQSHFRGVCSFTAYNLRLEHKNLLSKLIYSEWPMGTIAFRDMDSSSNIPAGYENVVTAVFEAGNNAAPMVLFDNCQLIGKHKYTYGTAAWNRTRTAKYNQCSDWTHSKPDDFLIADIVTPAGGRWLIELNECRGNASNSAGVVVWDAVYGSLHAMQGRMGKRSFAFRNAQGEGTPRESGSVTMRVPAVTVITRVTFRSSGSLTSAATVNFAVRDGLAGTIASSGSRTLGDAWALDIPLAYVVPAGGEVLTLVDTLGVANQTSSTVFVEVEFLVV